MLSENNKYRDETDFWKISGFDHACLDESSTLAYCHESVNYVSKIFYNIGLSFLTQRWETAVSETVDRLVTKSKKKKFFVAADLPK